jgi:hypothetical protein
MPRQGKALRLATKVKLPKRSGKGRYNDQATLKGGEFVPEK